MRNAFSKNIYRLFNFHFERQLKFFKFVCGFVVAISLGGCATPVLVPALNSGLLSVMNGGDGSEVLKTMTLEQQDTLLYFTYGGEYVYLTPEQRDYMFSDSRAFLWNVGGKYDVVFEVLADQLKAGKPLRFPDGKGGEVVITPTADVLQELTLRSADIQLAAKAWPTVRALNLSQNTAVLDAHIDLIKQRVGIDGFNTLKSGRARTLARLLHDDEALTKFLTDDQNTFSVVQTARMQYDSDSRNRSYHFLNRPTADFTSESLLKLLQPVSWNPTSRIGS